MKKEIELADASKEDLQNCVKKTLEDYMLLLLFLKRIHFLQ